MAEHQAQASRPEADENSGKKKVNRGVEVDDKYREIVNIAAEPLNRLFQQEAEAMVKRTLCEGHSCPQLCRRARHDVAMMVKSIWKGYAKLN